jgi:hypothetical protein
MQSPQLAWFTFCLLQRARVQRSCLGRGGFKANHWHALNRLIWVVVSDAAAQERLLSR